MQTVLTIIFVAISLVLVVAILLQSGKGNGLAAGFGGASAGTQMFGGSGAGGFLEKATVGLGALFMVISLTLAYMSSRPDTVMSTEGSGTIQSSQEDEIVKEGGKGAAGAAQPDPQPDQGDQAGPTGADDSASGTTAPGGAGSMGTQPSQGDSAPDKSGAPQ